MSRTTATSAAQAQTGDSGPRPGTARWRDPVTLVIAAATLLALALRAYQLARPGMLLGLTEYDDGPYFGSALRLASGALPYRDFVLVQPPGITLLMMPAALLAKATTTATGMAVGRVLTALASAAGVPLLGLLVRHRGVLAALAACGTLAVFPSSISAAHTVLVEAWLALFCLIGAVLVFDRDRLASGRRLIWGGVAFGFAGAVEPWAIVPVLVVAALCLPRVRQALRFVGGVAAGFAVPVVPFAALAPLRFYQSTIVAQIAPRAAAERVSAWTRARFMTGLSDSNWPRRVAAAAHLAVSEHLVVAGAAFLIAVLVAAGLIAALAARQAAPLDWFAAAAAAGVVAMFLWPSQFHYHFSAFLAPFLGMTAGLSLARLAGLRPRRHATAGPARGAAALPAALAAASALAVAMFAVIQVRAESKASAYLEPAAISATARAIPPGSCVASDAVSLLIVANRFLSDVPGCSLLVDGIGTDLGLSGGLKPSTGAGQVPAVARAWRDVFTHAQYVWLTSKNARRIAWTPALRAYFAQHFQRVPVTGSGDSLYRRVGG